MSQPELSNSSRLLSLVGIIGAILAFAAILFVAYLPSRPDPIDQAVNQERQAKADQARAAGLAKLVGFEVIDAEAGTVRIPIVDAMNSTVAAYQAAN